MGFAITLIIIMAVLATGMWLFDSDDDHNEWHGW